MAKRKAARRATPAKSARKAPARRRSAKRASAKRPAKRQASAKKKATAKKAVKKATTKGASRKAAPKLVAKKKAINRPKPKAAMKAGAKTDSSSTAPAKVPRLDRARRTLDEAETRTTPPSSLDMDRHGSAARTGRAEIAQKIREHHGMDDVTGGDPDVDIEDAYFAGEEAPGGDNPTPDQDIVEDIGKALGVTYNDNEELKGADKLVERDKHRWELDPASAEDYTDHDKE
jgi:Family of unknown function (DUF6335)